MTVRSRVVCGRATSRAREPRRNGLRHSSAGVTARPRAASSSSCPTTSSPTTTGSCPSRRRWPRISAFRSSSPTTSTTRNPRTASSPTCWLRSATAGRSTRSGTCGGADGESYLKGGPDLAAMPPANRVRRRPIRGRLGPGRPGSRRRPRWRRRVRSISGSSSTASRASRCPAARRRSATWSSCARSVRGSGITRSRRLSSSGSPTSSRSSSGPASPSSSSSAGT